MNLAEKKCKPCEGGVPKLAEEEGHHPVMQVFFSNVKIEIWTHAIPGLSENDFILASKIDEL